MKKRIATLFVAVLTVLSLSIGAFAVGYVPEDGYFLVEPPKTSNTVVTLPDAGSGSIHGTKAEIVTDANGKLPDFVTIVFTIANSDHKYQLSTAQKSSINNDGVDCAVTIEQKGDQLILRSHTAIANPKRIIGRINLFDEVSQKNVSMVLGFESTELLKTPDPKPDPKPDPEPDPKPDPKPDAKPVVLPEIPKPSDEPVKVDTTGNSTLDTILSSILKVFTNAKIFGVWVVVTAILIGAIFIVALWLWRMLRAWLQRAKG